MAIVKGTSGSETVNGTAVRDLIYGYNPDQATAGTVGMDLELIVKQAGAGAVRPLNIQSQPADGSHLFVATQEGLINVVELTATGTGNSGQLLAAPFLDLRGEIAFREDLGLSGFAFHPDFADKGATGYGKFYVYVAVEGGDGTPDNEIWEYRVDPDNPLAADEATKNVIFRADQPGNSHRVGNLAFGPDGYLYVGRGDGLNPYDGLHVAQDPDSLLGKILRIDVDHDGFASTTRDYAIPPDNAFAGGGGQPEIWAMGMRNPWKFSFDRATGGFWEGDVGQIQWEEVNHVRAGMDFVNFGWGWQGYEADAPVPPPEGWPPDQPFSNIPTNGLTFPVHDYFHTEVGGQRVQWSVTGGYVYRGGEEAMQGQYFFADFGRDLLQTLDPQVRVRDADYPSDPTRDYKPTDWTSTISLNSTQGVYDAPATFGEDALGNLYVMGINGNLYRVSPRSTAPTDAGDTIPAGAGRDFVFAGGGDDGVTGDAGPDVLNGQDGADTLDGGIGNDSLIGGDGDDSLIGGAGADTILGGSARDALLGGGGDDMLEGGDQPDTLTGGTGVDDLRGSGGGDRFSFGAGDSATGSPDRIMDFAVGDRIDVGRLAGPAMTFRGTGAFTGGAEVRYDVSGGNATVEVDADGDRTADLVVLVLNTTSLAETNFIL